MRPAKELEHADFKTSTWQCWSGSERLEVRTFLFSDQFYSRKPAVATQMGIEKEFKASNGWLEKLKIQYNIEGMTVCGESGDRSMRGNSSVLERAVTSNTCRLQPPRHS